jgi:hypothetical protein
VNGEESLAQQPLKRPQTKSAINEFLDETAVCCAYSWDLPLATASKWLIHDETNKNSSSSFEVLVRKCKNEKMVFERK